MKQWGRKIVPDLLATQENGVPRLNILTSDPVNSGFYFDKTVLVSFIGLI